jgi:hypoxanthine phosphoribosyltransferase
VTRKNRKMRRLRELYPDIRIKLLYRRDCERLGDSYRESSVESGLCREGRILYSEEQIQARIASLVDAIESNPIVTGVNPSQPGNDGERAVNQSLPIWQMPEEPLTRRHTRRNANEDEPEAVDDRLIVMSVDPGSAVFAHHLAAELEKRGVAIARDRVRLTRHRSPSGQRRVKIAKGPRSSIAGRRILLVADVVSTGLSHAYLTSWLRRRGAAAIEICTLLDRQAARLVEVPVRYAAFDAPNELLVGFGLHLRRQFRHLPYIATLVTEPIEVAAPTNG